MALRIEAPAAEMPRKVRPMLAVPVGEPFSDPDWLFEIKWDGYRAIAEVDNGTVDLYSRNLISFNERFHPLVETLQSVPMRMVLDGEIVVLDEEGRSHFQLLQRWQRTGEGTLVYYVFDLLYFDRYDLTGLPLIRRKEILGRVLPELPDVKLSGHIEADGSEFFEAARRKDLEGIMGKRKSSPYLPGTRSRDWVKVRNRLRLDAVVAGYTVPKGGRKNFGSLVLGVPTDGRLDYIGHVGTGFDDADLQEIGVRLSQDRTASNPFVGPLLFNASDAQWVVPKLIVQVEFNGWTEEGLLRQPVFIGVREDQSFPPLFSDLRPGGEEAADAEVKIANPDKIFWPGAGYRKKDMVRYYEEIADTILPYLKDRPQILHRYPDGIGGQSFFQQDVADLNLPSWAASVSIRSRSQDEEIERIMCQNKSTLLYLANLGCVEINPWNSTVKTPNRPDYVVIDLDPEQASFDLVIKTAQALREVLEELEIASYPKTSGARGIHVYVPLGAKYAYREVKEFSRIIAILVNKRVPEITSLARMPAKRRGKVYPDWQQNSRGKTVAAPYSLRPEPGAPVSAPLKWSEVKEGLTPGQFNLCTIFDRLEKEGDLFAGALGEGIDMMSALEKIDTLLNS